MPDTLKMLLPLAALFAFIAVVALLLKRLGLLGGAGSRAVSADAEGPLPYRRRDYLLSRAEMAFYRALVAAVGGRGVVMAKVRLADLVLVQGSGGERQRHFNRVSAKHADFVLCDAKSLRPLLAIELDDASHDSPDRQDRDEFVDRALAAAGLPLLRVRAARAYDPAAVARRVEAAIGSMPTAT